MRCIRIKHTVMYELANITYCTLNSLFPYQTGFEDRFVHPKWTKKYLGWGINCLNILSNRQKRTHKLLSFKINYSRLQTFETFGLHAQQLFSGGALCTLTIPIVCL